MPTDWNTVNAKCPFYKTETQKSITCEGLLGNSIIHNFNLSIVQTEYTDKYCNSVKGCKNCLYHKALINMKYPYSE
nr:hypothetical protein [uncultured Ruminococcus sp.]